MEYLLALAIAGLVAFLGLLLYFDLPPKMAVDRIARRLTGGPEISHLNVTDAPYRRIGLTAARAPKPVLLNIETSDASGQPTHPDVVYAPEGFGARKWPYWMVCTPYPYGNDFFENPELFASFDGVNWQIPDGAKNPLVPSCPIKGDHHSDPDLVLHQNQLWLFFRQTLRSKTPTKNRILLMKSGNGVDWSNPTEILLDQKGTGLLSPAVICDENGFLMWMIEQVDGKFAIIRRLSEDGTNWTGSRKCEIAGSIAGRNLWHIDVIPEKDRLSALVVTCTGQVGEGSRIHYAYSFNQGETWNIGPFLLERVYEFEAALQYRATMRKVQEDPPLYEVWYSAASSKYVWSIAYLRFVREENILLPYFSS